MPGKIPLRSFTFLILATAVSLAAGPALGGHPLGTEDAVTQGKGNVEVEFNYEHFSRGGGVRESALGNAYTLGLARRIDLSFVFTYLYVDPGDDRGSVRGMGDTEATIKTSFGDGSGWIPAVGIKAGALLPTGEEAKEFGTGRPNGRFTVIADWQVGGVLVHANLGVTVASRPIGSRDRDDSVSASVAAEWKVGSRHYLLGEYLWEKNIGASGNASSELLVGALTALSPNVTLDAGIRWGMTGAAPDVSYLAGVTLAFSGGD